MMYGKQKESQLIDIPGPLSHLYFETHTVMVVLYYRIVLYLLYLHVSSNRHDYGFAPGRKSPENLILSASYCRISSWYMVYKKKC